MTHADTDRLIRQLIGGDAAVTSRIVAEAGTSVEPALLVAAALIAVPTGPGNGLLSRAARLATSTRDRQLVVIATAHLAGDTERVDALAREHLVDHPDNVLVAWIAATSRTTSKEKS
jgi:hypothetical protein